MLTRHASVSSFTRTVLTTALGLVVMTGTARAQASLEPRLLEFLPAATARAAGTHYDLEISVSGSTTVLQRLPLGTPSVDADGMVRLNVAAQLTAAPAAGVSYSARILAVSAAGTTVSVASSPFTFTRCTVTVAPSAPLAAAGGPANVAVAATGRACDWQADSTAPWLTVVSGGTGRGPGRIGLSATANTRVDTRTAELTVGSQRYVISQAGVAPRTIEVATEPALQAAIAALTSGTTLVLAPGHYRLQAPLHITGPLADIVVTGATEHAADVVIEGTDQPTTPATALQVIGDVDGLRLANVTIQRFTGHAIQIEAGAQAPHLTNLHLRDTGASLVRVAVGVNDGILEGSTLEAAAAGLDLRGTGTWIVRLNAFRDLRGIAVAASAGAYDTVVTQNLLVECAGGISFGLTNRKNGVEHTGGRISNNLFYRGPTVAGGPGIAVIDSPDTVIAHNTVLTSQTAAPISYRFAATTNVTVSNNLVDGLLEARDGAWALESGNVTDATPDLFVDAPGGNLHLRRTAAARLHGSTVASDETIDIDGEPRPANQAPTAGADETLLSQE